MDRWRDHKTGKSLLETKERVLLLGSVSNDLRTQTTRSFFDCSCKRVCSFVSTRSFLDWVSWCSTTCEPAFARLWLCRASLSLHFGTYRDKAIYGNALSCDQSHLRKEKKSTTRARVSKRLAWLQWSLTTILNGFWDEASQSRYPHRT